MGITPALPPGEDAGSPPGPTPTGLSFALTGLSASTTYFYRIVASNLTGTFYGEPQSFTTLEPVSRLTTEEPTNVMPTSATLTGSFDAEPLDTHFHFSYYYVSCGWNIFGELESCGSGGSGETSVGEVATPSGLTKVSIAATVL